MLAASIHIYGNILNEKRWCSRNRKNELFCHFKTMNKSELFHTHNAE